MKGRPITRDEFDRMLAKVPAVVSNPLVHEWTRLPRGTVGIWAAAVRVVNVNLGRRYQNPSGLVWKIPRLESASRSGERPQRPDVANGA